MDQLALRLEVAAVILTGLRPRRFVVGSRALSSSNRESVRRFEWAHSIFRITLFVLASWEVLIDYFLLEASLFEARIAGEGEASLVDIRREWTLLVASFAEDPAEEAYCDEHHDGAEDDALYLTLCS